MLKSRVEEFFESGRFADTAVEQALREEW